MIIIKVTNKVFTVFSPKEILLDTYYIEWEKNLYFNFFLNNYLQNSFGKEYKFSSEKKN